VADWIDTLYERNWHELPELDVVKLEREATAQAIAHAQMADTPMRLNDALLRAQQFYNGYMDQVHNVMAQLQAGTLPPEHLAEMRLAQMRARRGKHG